MKKQLLSVVFCSFLLSASAQSLQTENFNSLPIGNIGTDITGTTPGQGSFLTFVGAGSGNANNSNFQVVANDATHQNALQITGSNVATGSRLMWKDGLLEAWGTRTAGNNIIAIEFDFFTGPATTSKNAFRVVLYNEDSSQVLAGYNITMDTKVIQGILYVDNNGTLGNYLLNLGATPVTLPANTWVKLGMSFNQTTGEVLWKGPGIDGGYDGAATGSEPAEVDFAVAAGTSNAVAGVGLFDNLTVKATDQDALLSVEDVVTSGKFAMYPNPTKDIFTLESTLSGINTIEVTDINGRTVKTVKANGVNQTQVNISDLTTGVYLVKVQTEAGTSTKKIIKN
ncbi:T9SS type A sorting domain-containing protein [Flavobacterium sp. '19STA2R22 D10 B1']|uniref:T9SS type A sorting domain-containing protein n=1 Tax=Flavobacterium aerium TaxID=3037261 RepID=UPI00278C2EDA|nr:T9SS type A sorting domain-containing protein [Flavobacterium sp. '19STA2R22 D10 B1']